MLGMSILNHCKHNCIADKCYEIFSSKIITVIIMGNITKLQLAFDIQMIMATAF